jgi:hypothetical protein
VLFLYSCVEVRTSSCHDVISWQLITSSLSKICFLLYLLFTSTYIQQPSPPSDLTSAQSTALFMRVLQSGLAERYEDVPSSDPDSEEDDGDQDQDEVKVDVSVRQTRSGVGESPARSLGSIESSPAQYNLRQRTPRNKDPSYVYMTGTPTKTSTSRRNETNPLSAVDNSHELASTSTPTPKRSSTSSVQNTRRHSLSKDLDIQMHSILSGERYTFSSDLSAARRSHRGAVGPSDSRKTGYVRLLEEQKMGGMESPDVKVTRLDRDDARAIEFGEKFRSWSVISRAHGNAVPHARPTIMLTSPELQVRECSIRFPYQARRPRMASVVIV